MNKIVLPVILFLSCTLPQGSSMHQQFAPNPVVAHRGAFKQNGYPENSIASLKEAIRLKCTGTEFDVRMTADDSLIINNNTHYNQLEIEKTSFGELSATPLSTMKASQDRTTR